MSGLRSYGEKQRRQVRRRNHVARDLHTPKYGPRIKESNKHHQIDELHEKDAEEELYWFMKELGFGEK